MIDDDPQFTNTLPSGGVAALGGEAVGTVAEENANRRLEPGEYVGRYRIRERVGEGGMGVVYAAEDPELGRLVAIKVLRGAHGDDAESQQRRMLREAQALARVSHRNLVMVFDVGSLRGRVWIAMEYVAGDTLETWLDRGRRTWSEIVDVFIEAGRGLAAVHAAGLVHRDFKPGNVIVREDGTVQVLDFGLAARAGELDEARSPDRVHAPPDLDALAASLTTTGAFMGTPAYMAPEQFMMLPTDGRADQFSLCVALYEAIYGHRPFKGHDLAQLMAATLQGLDGPPSELPGVPLAVRQVIGRGLARSPEDRFADMNALVDSLARTRAPAQRSSHGLGRFALGMIAGGGVLAIALVVWLGRQPDDASTGAATPAEVTSPARADPPAPPALDPPPQPPSTAVLPTVLDEPEDSSSSGGPEAPPVDPEGGAHAPTRGPSEPRGLPQADPTAAATDPSPSALPSLADLDEGADDGGAGKPVGDPKDPPPAEPAPAEPASAASTQ